MSYTYNLHGARYLRKYTASERTSCYAYMADVRKIANSLCNIPWERASRDYAACNSLHTDEGLDWNEPERERFDAAEWCADHSDGMHRAFAQAACYVFDLPESARGIALEKVAAVVTSDPFNPYGARISCMVSDTLEIPMACETVRTGDAANGNGMYHAPDASGMGVAPRLYVSNSNGTQTWYSNSETAELTPASGVTILTKRYLFVFVCLENYNRGRDGWIEGSSFIENDVAITLASASADLVSGELNECSPKETLKVFHVVRGGVTQDNYTGASGRYAIELTRNGDSLDDVFAAETGVDQDIVGSTGYNVDAIVPEAAHQSDVVGLRSLYAKFYSAGLKAVQPSSVHFRTGAGFAVQFGTMSVTVATGESTTATREVKGWRMFASSLVVPFSVPIDSRATRIWFGWDVNGTGGPSNGGVYNFWLKRGEYVETPPDETLKKADIYIGEAQEVDGWEHLGRSNLASGTAEFSLDAPLGDRVATVMITAFASQDDVPLPDGSSAVAPIGVPVGAADGVVDEMRPSIALVSGDGDIDVADCAPPPGDYPGLKFTALQANSTISMNPGENAPQISLVVSRDGKRWRPFIPGLTTVTLARVGDSVFFAAGDGGNSSIGSVGENVTNRRRFVMSGSIAASGDVTSLLDKSAGITDLTGRGYCFNGLFDNCASLTTPPALPATTLADRCYYFMFCGCTSLTTAPALPATTLAANCYYFMFYRCTSLTTAPTLPATTLAESCYNSMFYGCTSLTTAPALPATTLVSQCYRYMFSGCSRLNSLSVYFTAFNPSLSSTSDWLHGVAASGTFSCGATLYAKKDSWSRNASSVPSGWAIALVPGRE